MATEDITRRDERGHLSHMLIIGAIASALGIALALLIDWFPVQATREGEQIDTMWDVLLIASVPVFVLCQSIVLYCVWKFRLRPGQENLDGPPIHGNTKLEVIWTTIPALLLFGLCTYAYIVLADIEDARANTMEVRVVGEQFTWTFFYRNPDGGEEIASNRLYLPNDTAVKFNVQSKDVLHDFWVPAFRMKIDAVPGITTNYRVRTKREGTYPVVCAELCGLGHSVMRQSATVMAPQEFESWLAEQAQGGGEEGGGQQAGGGEQEAADPKALFASQETRCGQCHVLADAGSNGNIGPNLDESLQGKDAEYIRQGIVEPNAVIASGYQQGIMPPNYGDTLSPEQVDALVDYLAEATQ